MLARLTVSLTVAPERGWKRYYKYRDRLPSAAVHVAFSAGLVGIATLLGGVLRTPWTTAGALLHALAAFAGCALAGLSALQIAPGLLGVPDHENDLARYAAGGIQPLLLSGACNVMPVLPLNALLALGGTTVSIWSAWVGAGTLFGLQGLARIRTACIPVALAVGPMMLAVLVRWALPT